MAVGLIVFETPFTAGISFSLVLAPRTILLTISLGNRLNRILGVIHRETSFAVCINLSISPTCSLAAVKFRCEGSIPFLMHRNSGSECIFVTLNLLLSCMHMVLLRPNTIVLLDLLPTCPAV